MSTHRSSPEASRDYNSAKVEAIRALNSMTVAMRLMGSEHVNFHNHFDVQKKLQVIQKAWGGKELHVEYLRSKALDGYLSEGNLPKVTALGHMELEGVLQYFRHREKELDEIQKKTARLVESLLGDRGCTCENGHGARA